MKNKKVLWGALALLVVLATALTASSGQFYKGSINSSPSDSATGSLSVSLASPTTDDHVVRGTSDVVLASFNLTAGSGEDVTVTDLTFTGYVNEDSNGSWALGGEGGVNFNDIVIFAKLVDADTGIILASPQPFSTAGTVTFASTNFLVGMGAIRTVRVVADIGMAGIPYGGNNDLIAVDILDIEQDVIAESAVSGDAILVSGADNPNGGTNPTRVIMVKAGGYIEIASSLNPVLNDKAVAGANSSGNPLLVARYRIFAQDEAFTVEKMTFSQDNVNGAGNSATTTVILHYPTSVIAPTTLDGSVAGSLNSGVVTFNGLNIAVPESVTDENAINVELSVVTAGIGLGTNSGDVLDFDYVKNGTFVAIGLTSGTNVTQASTPMMYGTSANIMGNNIALYKSLPTFEKHTSSTVCPATGLISASQSPIYCLKVTAAPQGDVGLKKLTFDVAPVYLNTGKTGGLWTLNGFTLSEYDASGNVSATVIGQGTWSPNSKKVYLNFNPAEFVIPAGTSKYLVLKAPIASTATGGNRSAVGTRLAEEPPVVTNHSASTNVGFASQNRHNSWSDRSAASHSWNTNDWTNSYKLDTLPTPYLDLTQ